MTLVIGVDEAGYGPNLGPLAIGLSAWQVTGKNALAHGEQCPLPDLYQLLSTVVANKPDGRRIAVADSKQLYKPGGGLTQLERGVLSMLALAYGNSPACWNELIDTLSADVDGCRHELPWHQNGFDPAVPIDCAAGDLAAATDLLQTGLLRTGLLQKNDESSISLRAMRARLVFPAQFNAKCEFYASKGLALSHWSLHLLRTAVDELTANPPSSNPLASNPLAPNPLASSLQTPAPIYVTCDKHGGRNRYGELLAEHFPEYTQQTIVESRPRSAYLLARDGVELHVEFRTKGETALAAALASMIAKLLRELSMQALNTFWQSHVPGLKPTAGYPMDAKRYKAAIAAKQRELGIADNLLWRNR